MGAFSLIVVINLLNRLICRIFNNLALKVTTSRKTCENSSIKCLGCHSMMTCLGQIPSCPLDLLLSLLFLLLTCRIRGVPTRLTEMLQTKELLTTKSNPTVVWDPQVATIQ